MDLSITDKKKYNLMENVLIKINQKFIALPENEKKTNVQILEKITDVIIGKMKSDKTFDTMYERKFYGGSYFDNVRIGNAEEFDIDLVLRLPQNSSPRIEVSDKPGFVHLQLTTFDIFLKNSEVLRYPKLESLMEDSYISVFKVLFWIESLFTKTLNELIPENKKEPSISITLPDQTTVTFYPKIVKQYPAFTLKLTGRVKEKLVSFDVDLVPCFEFGENMWPSTGYRSNVTTRTKFMIVPKVPREDVQNKYIYWRLSFQEQERDLIKGSEYKVMKPTLKLLKKLRNQQNHKVIASYFIKTIFLWEAQNQSKEFWSKPLSLVFMTMLSKYADAIQTGSIPYYWNDQNNLIEHLKQSTYKDIGNQLKNIASDVEKNLGDPFIICKYLLSEKEYGDIKNEVDFGKKNVKLLNEKKENTGNISPVSIGSSPIFKDNSDITNVLQASTLLDNEVESNSSTDKILKYIENVSRKTDKIVDVMESLQNENKIILDMCSNLLDKMSQMEMQISELKTENNLLKTRFPTDSLQSNVDRLIAAPLSFPLNDINKLL